MCGANWQGWEQEAVLAQANGDLQVYPPLGSGTMGCCNQGHERSRKWHLWLQQVNFNDCQGELKRHLETLPAKGGGPGPGIPQISCPRLQANGCYYCYSKPPSGGFSPAGRRGKGTGYSRSLAERRPRVIFWGIACQQLTACGTLPTSM